MRFLIATHTTFEVLLLLCGVNLIVKSKSRPALYTRFRQYITHNSKKILGTYLFTMFLASLLPDVIRWLSYPVSTKVNIPPAYLLSAIALLLLLYLYLHEYLKKFLARYRNTYRAMKPGFTYFDYLGWIGLWLTALLLAKYAYGVEAYAAVCLALLVMLCVPLFVRSRMGDSPVDTVGLWFTDEPIVSESQDLLGRGRFVKGFQGEITNIPFSDSFVFGLHGRWGEGKTSAINLLSRKFKESRDYIVVEFDAWYFKGEKVLLSAFYDEVEKALRSEFILPGLKRNIYKYLKLLSPQLTPPGLRLNLSIDENIDELRSRIESSILLTKRKLILFIDDIDRLQPAEILEVLRLVRLNANLKNTIFVLSFDRHRVMAQLKEAYKLDGEYLEKIIQKDVYLPPIRQTDIENFIDLHLSRLWRELGVSRSEADFFSKEFGNLYQAHIRKLFTTLRKVKRYLNCLRTTLPLLHTEVSLLDICVLGLIEQFYPEVYSDIKRQPSFYVPVEWGTSDYLLSAFLYAEGEEAKFKKIRDHVEGITAGYEDRELILSLLQVLFPVNIKRAFSKTDFIPAAAENYRLNKRITHPDIFVLVLMLFDRPNVTIDYLKTKIEQWGQNGVDVVSEDIQRTFLKVKNIGELKTILSDLLDLKSTLPDKAVYGIISAISQLAGQLSKIKGGSEGFFQSEWDRAFALMLALLNERTPPHQIHKLVLMAATTTPYKRLAVDLVSATLPRTGGSYFRIYNAIDTDDLLKTVSDSLKKHYVEDRVNIFAECDRDDDWRHIISNWSSYWLFGNKETYVTVNSYLQTLYSRDPAILAKIILHIMDLGGREEAKHIYDVASVSRAAEYVLIRYNLTLKRKEIIQGFIGNHLSPIEKE
jgi:KAP family P-loop domain